MLKLLSVFDAIGAFFTWLKDHFRRQEQAQAREDGAAHAANETGQVITETADAQARVNADRPDALSVAGKLRADADRAEGGGSGEQPDGG